MDLTPTNIAYLETRLGELTDADRADVEARVDRLEAEGSAAPVAEAAAEVLRVRLATMVKNPLQFSIPGDYSENRTANVEQLRAALAAAEADAGMAGSVLTAAQPVGRWGR